tara:strand:+ start:26089 stop:26454 length:366 start_codon:yes stop_codon:yes gene_type:complete
MFSNLEFIYRTHSYSVQHNKHCPFRILLVFPNFKADCTRKKGQTFFDYILRQGSGVGDQWSESSIGPGTTPNIRLFKNDRFCHFDLKEKSLTPIINGLRFLASLGMTGTGKIGMTGAGRTE